MKVFREAAAGETPAEKRPELPIVFNLNIGHAMPRCIMPFGVPAEVDAEQQVIRFAD